MKRSQEELNNLSVGDIVTIRLREKAKSIQVKIVDVGWFGPWAELPDGKIINVCAHYIEWARNAELEKLRSLFNKKKDNLL
jgi:hypothetical protein